VAQGVGVPLISLDLGFVVPVFPGNDSKIDRAFFGALDLPCSAAGTLAADPGA